MSGLGGGEGKSRGNASSASSSTAGWGHLRGLSQSAFRFKDNTAAVTALASTLDSSDHPTSQSYTALYDAYQKQQEALKGVVDLQRQLAKAHKQAMVLKQEKEELEHKLADAQDFAGSGGVGVGGLRGGGGAGGGAPSTRRRVTSSRRWRRCWCRWRR